MVNERLSTDAAPADPSRATVDALARQLETDPLNRDLHRSMMDAMTAAGDATGAFAHRVAMLTFDALADTVREQPAVPLYNLATVYFMKGEPDAAAHWYRRAIDVQPTLAIAHQNLAAVLERQGHANDAQQHRERAYAIQRVFVEPVPTPRRTMLVLCSGRASSNVPFERLLTPGTTSLVRYVIDYADVAEDKRLPPFDIVFNALGEPDIAVPLVARLKTFARKCKRPLLNRPDVVARTQRHRTAALLEGIDDVVVPHCVRIDAAPASADALARELSAHGLALPLLMRPLATHGGEGLVLHESLDTLWAALAAGGAPCYLTQFHDFRAADGYYRKYRCAFVDRQPLPYHAAISPQWMVHYFSAEMIGNAWKLEEEQRFLEDPRAALGERAARAIAAIARRIDLDYAGIDFTLLPDGRVLVFETNAAMLIHREADDGPLAHKNAFIDKIIDAFERMLASRHA